MKYISLIVFTAALVWTWNVVHDASSISFETHSGIQERLAEVIVDTIKNKRPSASEIVVEKIWTEVIGANKVRAFFVYSFKDISESGPVKSEIRGEGVLERQAEDASGNDRWALTKVRTTSDAIQFDEATLITGNPAAPAEQNQPEEHPPEEHK